MIKTNYTKNKASHLPNRNMGDNPKRQEKTGGCQNGLFKELWSVNVRERNKKDNGDRKERTKKMEGRRLTHVKNE